MKFTVLGKKGNNKLKENVTANFGDVDRSRQL